MDVGDMLENGNDTEEVMKNWAMINYTLHVNVIA